MNSKKQEQAELKGIKNITISGRIGTGKSTLAQNLADAIGWDMLDGGKIFRKLAVELGISIVEKNKVPDQIDIDFEEKVKQMLTHQNHQIIQSHLAGFVAQGISGVYKILVVCEDDEGEDKASIRIDRLMNRDALSGSQAKHDVTQREKEHLEKFRRLYAKDESDWVYWNPNYYDLIVNTFHLNKQEALEFVLKNIHFKV